MPPWGKESNDDNTHETIFCLTAYLRPFLTGKILGQMFDQVCQSFHVTTM